MKHLTSLILAIVFCVYSFSQCDESESLIEVIIYTDSYAYETSWTLSNEEGEIMSGGSYENYTEYVDSACVSNIGLSCVTFTLNDSYGDGICCGYGEGWFVINVNGEEVMSGGEFGSEISGEVFCPEILPLEDGCGEDQQEVVVSILTDNYPGETTWTLTGTDGPLLSGGPYSESGTLFSDTVCVPADQNNCLLLVINDSYGDGLCCSYGLGAYYLYVDGEEIASGGEFGGQEQVPYDCGPGMLCAEAVEINSADYGTIVQETGNHWYTFTPDQNGMYEFNSCGSGCNSTIYIYDYCNMANFDDTNEGTIYYDDDQAGCDDEAALTVLLEGGVQYWIRWGSSDEICDGITWNFDFIGPPSGCMDPDACNYNPLAEEENGTCIYAGDPSCSGPDLIIVSEAIENTLYATTMEVGETDCYIEEGCLNGFGTRELIRFTTHIKNIGDLDYYIGSPNGDNNQFEWGNCHNHWHHNGYAKYDLFTLDGGYIPVGFKNGFCVMDLECSGGGTAQYGCGTMGISAGCGDIYSSGLSCQWIDVTGVEDGTYFLVVRANWEYIPDALGRHETDYENNWGVVCIEIDRTDGFIVTILDGCQEFTDCSGTPYGTSVFDCTGECGGSTLMGDVDDDFDQDLNDAQSYVEGVLGDDIPSTACYDLNSDGDINVTDAVIMADCQFWNVAHEHPDSSGVHSHCDFPLTDITNPFDEVSFSIGDVNWEEKYFDVQIMNPDNKVYAYQLEFDGIQIAYTESLVDPEVYAGVSEHAPGGNTLVALSYDGSTIPKHMVHTSIMRVHWFGSANSMICISEVIDVVNSSLHNTLTALSDACVEQVVSACPGDTDDDLFVTVDDILNVLGEFGCTSNCEHDVNGDGAINVEDILLVLSAFGTAC